MRALLVRLSALGDVVHTWPLAVALKLLRPDIHLTWVIEEPLAPLVEGHPAVDDVVTVATRRWRRRPFSGATRSELRQLWRRLRGLSADLALDPQGVAKSALIVRLSGARDRVGLARPWRREAAAGLAYNRALAVGGEDPHVVRTNLELVRALGVTPPETAAPPDGRWLLAGPAPAAEDPSAEPFVLIIPGAGNPAKLIPVEVLAGAGRRICGRGVRVVVAWGPGEADRARRIVATTAGAELAPPTDLLQLTALMGSAAAVIGSDTGPVHLAASLGVPTVAAFTATDPARNRPLGPNVEVVSTVAEGGTRGTGSARIAAGPPVTPELLEAATVRALADLLR